MIKRPKIWLVVSLATIIASMLVVGLIRPQWGIDFTGGSLLEIEAAADNIASIEEIMTQEFELASTIQSTIENTLIIRTAAISNEVQEAIVSHLLDENLMSGEILRFESIGPTIGQELRRKSWIAITLVVITMIVYLAYTFREAAGLISPWKFGLAAAYALLHDLLLVTAIFVVLGKLMGVTIDTLFVTAMLAILGYSVNDTIVLFNRLKSEWVASRRSHLLTIIDRATKATIIRSLNTSLTTLLVLVSLLIFGGTTIQWFIVALIAGTVAGTYSSIFVAPPFLYYLSKK